MAAYGMYTQFGLGPIGVLAATPTEKLDYQSEDLGIKENLVDTNGLRGTRSHFLERIMPGLQLAAGNVRFIPNSLEWTYLLPWITSGTPDGTTYPLGEYIVTRDVWIDRIKKVFAYLNTGVDTARFRATQGQALELELNCCATEEVVYTAGSFPVLIIDSTTKPFMFYHLAMTVGGVDYYLKEFDFTIDNRIDKDRFFNTQNLTEVNAMDRIVTLRTSMPYDDAFSIYNTGATGIDATAVFTNGLAVMTITMPGLTFPRQTPQVPGRQEIMLPIEGTCYRTVSTAECVFVLSPGP